MELLKMRRLQDKVTIVTGAANGIGFEAARTFAREGAKIVIADYDKRKGMESEQALIAEKLACKFIQVNVADQESVKQMVQDTLETYERIDVLVNNAGITRDTMFRKMTADQFQQVLDVNLTGVFNCAQAVLPTMLEQGSGKIISTSSVSGV